MSAISRVQISQIWSNKYLLLLTLNPGGGISIVRKDKVTEVCKPAKTPT